MTIVPASEIPSVSLLYHLKKLVAAEDYPQDVVPKPSKSLNDKIGLIRGDITKLEVDAIVNAANNSLLGGGGVDGAIHRAAGLDLLKECRTLDGCDTGSAKITGGYELPSKKVIHSVGPVYSLSRKEESERNLRSCYITSLKLAVENDCKTVAFSALSTGVYGYPSSAAAPVAIKAVKDFLEGSDGDKLEKVIFTTFVQKDVDAYNRWLPRFFPPHEVVDTNEPVVHPVKSEDDSEWEEVLQTGDSADNGLDSSPKAVSFTSNESIFVSIDAKDQQITTDSGTPTLPEVPRVEPGDEGPSPKKSKANEE